MLQRTLAEILGLAQGYCRGRGGSMHLQWFEAGALGTNAIVGGGAPMAAGNAWAQKRTRRGTDSDITINYFGDGASQIGSILESMNLAATWKLPVCFFIENNLYAVSTRADEISADPRFSIRGQGFAIPSWRVDGMDPLAVHLAMQGRRKSACAPATARRSSRPRSTASSTRTARTRAARSATAPKTRRPPGASATRSSASRPR